MNTSDFDCCPATHIIKHTHTGRQTSLRSVQLPKKTESASSSFCNRSARCKMECIHNVYFFFNSKKKKISFSRFLFQFVQRLSDLTVFFGRRSSVQKFCMQNAVEFRKKKKNCSSTHLFYKRKKPVECMAKFATNHRVQDALTQYITHSVSYTLIR